MKLFCMVALVCALAVPAKAAEIMDGSYGDLPPQITAERIAIALVQITNDPFSAQIISLRAAAKEINVICGLINLKGPAGGYTGFQPFTFDLSAKQAFLGTSSRCDP